MAGLGVMAVAGAKAPRLWWVETCPAIAAGSSQFIHKPLTVNKVPYN